MGPRPPVEGNVARDGGWCALDLLVCLVGGVSAHELGLLELDDDVGAGMDVADGEPAGLDKLDMELAP
jgi:hypothetical protein